ncbi:MAG: methylated-DNA-[protein]-cysteine S-methyltransferase [Arenicella sp.]
MELNVTETIFYDHLDTPLGNMEISANSSAVLAILFVDEVRKANSNLLTDLAKGQLLSYFKGDLEKFDIPMDAKGTDFQKQVWQSLTTIGYGQTCSYSDIANKIENPKAVRAVGSANGKNPMTIVVPCHRVIGANGSLTGYASGVDRKAWLLNHESNSLF